MHKNEVRVEAIYHISQNMPQGILKAYMNDIKCPRPLSPIGWKITSRLCNHWSIISDTFELNRHQFITFIIKLYGNFRNLLKGLFNTKMSNSVHNNHIGFHKKVFGIFKYVYVRNNLTKNINMNKIQILNMLKGKNKCSFGKSFTQVIY